MDGLRSERLRLRRWREADRSVFHRLNSDETVMRFFPYRRNREEADEAMDRWNRELDASGMTFLAAERVVDGSVVGVVGLSPVTEEIYAFAPTVQVGWRLLPEAEGRGYATEAALACLHHGFEALALPEIVAQCAAGNGRSEAVMLRLGMRPRGEFPHPKVPADTHPHLVLHRLYAATREAWRGAAEG